MIYKTDKKTGQIQSATQSIPFTMSEASAHGSVHSPVPQGSVHSPVPQATPTHNNPPANTKVDTKAQDDAKAQEQDNALADRLSALIEHANEQVIPLCKMIRKVSIFSLILIHRLMMALQHIENFEAQKEEDRDEAELVKQVKPLLQQAEKILNETNGAIRGADPDHRLTNKAKRNLADHQATPQEQRLAEALKVVSLPYPAGTRMSWCSQRGR